MNEPYHDDEDNRNQIQYFHQPINEDQSSNKYTGLPNSSHKMLNYSTSNVNKPKN